MKQTKYNPQLYRTDYASERFAGGGVGVSPGWGLLGGRLPVLWVGCCRGGEWPCLRWGTYDLFIYTSILRHEKLYLLIFLRYF